MLTIAITAKIKIMNHIYVYCIQMQYCTILNCYYPNCKCLYLSNIINEFQESFDIKLKHLNNSYDHEHKQSIKKLHIIKYQILIYTIYNTIIII